MCVCAHVCTHANTTLETFYPHLEIITLEMTFLNY